MSATTRFSMSALRLGKKQLPQLFVDGPGIDREAVHNQVGQMAAEFFDKELVPAKKQR